MTRTKALSILIAILILSAGFADVEVFLLGGQIRDNQQNDNHALCAFRQDVQSRFDSAITFLATHPRGIPGVPNATLRLSLTSEQHTLAALSSLQC